jgi:hypothetical protein
MRRGTHARRTRRRGFYYDTTIFQKIPPYDAFTAPVPLTPRATGPTYVARAGAERVRPGRLGAKSTQRIGEKIEMLALQLHCLFLH